MTHSPLPWTVRQEGAIFDADGVPVISDDGALYPEDRDLIVTAVNNYARWNCTLFQSVSPSPPPPSGLREALQSIVEMKGKCLLGPLNSGDYGRGHEVGSNRAFEQAADVAKAALASSDDGWVKVDEEHPLPDDLTWGDETLEHHAYCKSPKVVAYRRRPSAEQGG